MALSLRNPSPSPNEEAALGIQRMGDYYVAGGGYSDVWKAEMKCAGSTLLVALKILRPIVSRDRLLKREGRELIWKSLRHDNIAFLHAVYHQSNGLPVFVSQWYENGTADKYLLSHPSASPLRIIYEIVSGLEYLHSRDVIHGDLKASNVLIDDSGHARLTDFGLSRSADAEPGLTTMNFTTLRWCAPELLHHDPLPTKSSDIYSVASTSLQLLTGSVPYSVIKDDKALFLYIVNGGTVRSASGQFRYNISHSEDLWELLEECWAMSGRPRIHQIKHRLLTFHHW